MSNANAGGEGERHYLTVLFADLSDSTQLSEVMQAEDYAALLAELRAICREIVPRHGGHIARIQGDGLLAFFGWPQANEGDGRRATEAALELHAAVARLAVGGAGQAALRLHSGIHGGLVLVAEGDLERGRFELLGKVPNIAARLSAEAARDDIVVSEETLGRDLRHFTASDRQSLAVKGVATPLGIYRIYGKAAQLDRVAPVMRRRPSPFVGREHELRALREHLRSACRGANVCCFVSAEAGMGKSRLVDELLGQSDQDGCVALRGYCESHLGAQPLQPFAQVLRALESMDEPVPAAVRERVGALLQAGLGSAAESDIAEICGVLDALAAGVPVLLVLDDWQWSDEASQLVLQSLRNAERAMLIVLTTRTPARELLLARPAEVIELQPLDPVASARITEALLPGADPFVSAEIHRYAGGTPLIVEELCHAARVRGPSWPQSLKFGSAVWLSGLIESRIALLPPLQVEITRAAAVIGAVFPTWLLERLTGCGAQHPSVLALAAADVLFPGEEPGTLRFKHGITRDVIYDAIGLRERQRLHRAIVDALSSEERGAEQHVESLAYHCAAAGLPAQAATHAEQAGDRAMTACALDRARALYAATLTALDAVGGAAEVDQRWCAVAHKLGLACVFDPLSIPDVALFERAVELARRGGRADAIARSEYWLAYVLYSKGRSLEARPHCEAALAVALELGDARFAAQVQSVYGQVLHMAADYAGALPLVDAALEHRSSPPSRPARSVPAGAVYTLACKACLLGDRGEFEAAHACFDEATALIGDVRHQVASSVLHWRCLVLQWQGRWTEALGMADDSAAIAESTRSRHQLAVGRSMAAYVRWIVSRDEDHAQMLRDATAWIEARGGRLAVSLNHSWMVEVALAYGREDEARRHAAMLFRRSRQADRLGEALGCRALARAASKLSQRARAERYLARADDAARARGSAHEFASNRLCEAQLMFDAKRPQQGLALLETASGMFERLAMAWHLERARRLAREAVT